MDTAAWTAGYVADVAYTFGYYTELNPLRAQLALLNRGVLSPQVETACELGFGQGVSVNVHAAASGVAWWGTDFNPAQASYARELAAASGAQASLHDDAFAEFVHRPDLPDFDYIGLHGIWSWISDANRAVIVDFLRRKLKPGGLVYISYNTLPGFTGFAPIRRLMSDHARELSAPGVPIVEKIEAALAFIDQLMASSPAYARAHPQLAARLELLRGQDRQYLAHEYFNRDWRPMYVTEVADLLQEAKLSYAGSAHLMDHVDAVNLTDDQRARVAATPEGMLRELVRDFMVNQQFRRDYWLKGVRRISAYEQAERLGALRIVLVTPAEEVPLKVSGALGEAKLSEAVYQPVLEALSDHKPHSLGEILERAGPGKLNLTQLQEAALLLAGGAHVAVAQDEAEAKRAKPTAARLNAHLQSRARSHGEAQVLASPVTGGGVGVGRFDQLFLQARSSGLKEPKDWAAQILGLIAAQGQSLVKDGVTLETPEANRAELLAQAQIFAEKKLPVLKGLGIAV